MFLIEEVKYYTFVFLGVSCNKVCRCISILIPNHYSIRGDAQYVHEACEKSLIRLGIDSIDLYYVHRIDKTVPIEETMNALKELVKAR